MRTVPSQSAGLTQLLNGELDFLPQLAVGDMKRAQASPQVQVIALGENRDAAIARLVAALRDYPILGVRTNITFLIGILEHPRFRAGDVDTGFLDREGDALAAGAPELPAFLGEALLQIDDGVRSEAEAQSLKPKAEGDPWTNLRGWRA